MNLKLHTVGAAILAASLITASVYAADKAPAKKAKAPAAPSAAAQIQELREALEKRIDKLESNLAAKDVELKQAQQEAAEAKAEAVKAQAAATSQSQAVSENAAAVSTLQSTVKDLKGANLALATQVSETSAKSVKKSELTDIAFGKVKIGATFFGDYSYYTDAGYGPTFADTADSNQPTGSNGVKFSSFNITRAYINAYYTPTDAVTLRITPDIFRAPIVTAVTSTASACTVLPCTPTITNTYTTDTSLTYRLKYAYIDLNKLFVKNKYLKNDKVTFGQVQNTLIDWEDSFLGHRYIYTSPWNYLGLSSTWVGLKVRGPVEVNGKIYLDYDLAAFNSAAYSSIETNDRKQFAGRLTWYPTGTKVDRTGFGATIYGNFGYNSSAMPTDATTAKNFPIDRFAAIGFYQTADKGYGIMGEYDLGHNSFSAKTLLAASPNINWAASNAWIAGIASAVLPTSAPNTRQQGFAVQGNARLGDKKSPFSVWGLYQYFQPNTNYSNAALSVTSSGVTHTYNISNSYLNFSRTVGGFSYKFNNNLDISVGDQNFRWINADSSLTGTDTNSLSVWTQYNF